MSANTLLQPLAEAVLPEAVFDFWAGRINPLWTRRRVLARVIARRQEAAGTVTLTLRANRHHRGFVAGQHVNVSAELEGARVTRSYSPSALAGRPDCLEISIRAVEGGRFSQWLSRPERLGEVLALDAAFGDMTLAADRGACVLLAAGSGITPFISMIRDQAAQGLSQPLTLLYWARTAEELCFVSELQALEREHAHFHLHLITTRDAAHPGERLSAALLRERVPGLAGQTVHACGPDAFVTLAAALASEVGCAFLGESFTPPALAGETGAPVRVTLARSRRELIVPAGQPLLTALEAQGLRPASGCRRGICNTCACAKAGGSSENLLTGARTHDAEASLKLCISAARSDITLDL